MAARIAHNLLKKQEAIGRVRGEKLNPEDAKALAEAQARLARPPLNDEGVGANGEASDAPSFREHSSEPRPETEKRACERKDILEQHGIGGNDKIRILKIEKGQRPDPATYMSEAFLKAHKEEFLEGASRIISTKNLQKYGPSQRDGTSFVFPTKDLLKIIAEANGDRGKLEDLLGLPRGQLGTGALSRVDFKDPSSMNIRVPSGNEAGANDQWPPGSRLPTGHLEGVIDVKDAPANSWTHENINIH